MDKEAYERFVKPNYIKIYLDLIEKKYPEKKSVCVKFYLKSKYLQWMC